MRKRLIDPEFFKDIDVKNLPYECRLFFIALWCAADREGKLRDCPERIKIDTLVYDNVDIDSLLNLLCKPKLSGKPFIIRYIVNGNKYIKILSWKKTQFPHKSEKPSEIPEPNQDDLIKSHELKELKIENKPIKKEVKINSDVQKVVLSYKIKTGINIDDKTWDKTYFKRFSKSAKQLIDIFENVENAICCIEYVSKQMEDNKLDWTLETCVKRAYDYKKYLEQEVNNGIRKTSL